jgi:hypothetical protein
LCESYEGYVNEPVNFSQFGVGPNDLTGRSVIGVNDTERAGKLTLISGTGLAPLLDDSGDSGKK